MQECPSFVKETFILGLKVLQQAYKENRLSDEEYLRGLEELLKPLMEKCGERRKALVVFKLLRNKRKIH